MYFYSKKIVCVIKPCKDIIRGENQAYNPEFTVFASLKYLLLKWFDQIEITKENFADTILNEIELLQ